MPLSHDLFSKLSQPDYQCIADAMQTRTYHAQEIVFYEGERARELLIVEEGRLRVYKTDAKGNEIMLHCFEAGDLVAEMPAFERITYPATARFETEGVLIALSIDRFETLLTEHPSMALGIIQSLTAKIRTLESTIARSISTNATEKVARFLYEHEDLLNTHKHHEIASLLHMKAETFSRVLKKLKDAGIISTTKPTTLLQKERLLDFTS